MQDGSELARAVDLVRDLRKRCPWDGAQTPATLRPYLVEEVLELDHAIAVGDDTAIRDELGDLLLHLAFQLVLAEERRAFVTADVVNDLVAKMQRRHPHLYGEAPPPRSWEHAKRETGNEKRSVLEGLPPALPPLLMAYRLQERAAGVGFDWPDASGPLEKVKEELAELERETGNEKRETASRPPTPDSRVVDEVGDLLFAVVNLSRKLGIEPGQALERANAKFMARFEQVEQLAEERGLEVGRASLEELDKLWEDVKRRLGP